MYQRNNMGLKFHVTFGERKQIIEVETGGGDEKATYGEVFPVILTKFGLNPGPQSACTIQYFDKCFSDWVDLGKDDLIDALSRLKIIVSEDKCVVTKDPTVENPRIG